MYIHIHLYRSINAVASNPSNHKPIMAICVLARLIRNRVWAEGRVDVMSLGVAACNQMLYAKSTKWTFAVQSIHRAQHDVHICTLNPSRGPPQFTELLYLVLWVECAVNIDRDAVGKILNVIYMNFPVNSRYWRLVLCKVRVCNGCLVAHCINICVLAPIYARHINNGTCSKILRIWDCVLCVLRAPERWGRVHSKRLWMQYELIYVTVLGMALVKYTDRACEERFTIYMYEYMYRRLGFCTGEFQHQNGYSYVYMCALSIAI